MLTYTQPSYEQLPFVDEHAVTVPASSERVWAELRRSAPRTGFRATEATAPHKLVLQGRHPFSRYALVFLIEAAEDGAATRVRAQTWAAFPGARGRVYRALVVGSGAHAVVARRMLRRLARRA